MHIYIRVLHHSFLFKLIAFGVSEHEHMNMPPPHLTILGTLLPPVLSFVPLTIYLHPLLTIFNSYLHDK